MKLAFLPRNTDLGLLVIRIGLAIVFIAHGYDKLTHIESTIGFFHGIGLSAFFAYFIGIVELVGGLSLFIAQKVRLAGWILAINMVFAIALVKYRLGFFGGYEFDLVLLFSSLGIALTGGGKYTIGRRR